MTVRLDLEYDGTAFAGWATQPGKRTVQAVLEEALARVVGPKHPPIAVTVAGRTDTGVHATGQVCSYEGAEAPLKGLNALLPRDVAVRGVSRAADGFDARGDAASRSYRYRVLTRAARSPFRAPFALHERRPLDRAALDACAAAIAGTHDLTAFTPTETAHRLLRRTMIAAAWVDYAEDELAFEIEGRSFLRHMNRVLVGTMLEVARGVRSVDSFTALLAGAPRSAAGPTAPAHGLCLTGVRYPSD